MKGAFTGATDTRLGAAKQADGGTLFLDEIGEMPLEMQVKLLRFTQTGTFQPVGGSGPQKVDVRIVSATNRDPWAEVEAGRFREDLYYRLYVVPVEMPPLRDRGADVLLVARHFLASFAKEEGKRFRGFAADAEAALAGYGWPGNVRQLQNVVRNIVVLHDGERVERAMLPGMLLRTGAARPAGRGAGRNGAGATAVAEAEQAPETVLAMPEPPAVAGERARAHGAPAFETRAVVESAHILAALRLTGRNVPRTRERLLGINPSTIYEASRPGGQAGETMIRRRMTRGSRSRHIRTARRARAAARSPRHGGREMRDDRLHRRSGQRPSLRRRPPRSPGCRGPHQPRESAGGDGCEDRHETGLISPARPRDLPARPAEPEADGRRDRAQLDRVQSWIGAIHTYREFVQHPMDMLADRLEALGLGEGRVGIDADFLPLASAQHLARRLPGLRLVDSAAEVMAVRAIKTPAQVAILEAAARGTHRAALDAMQAARLGDSEIAMVTRIGEGMVRNGAERPFFLYLLSGDRTTVSHGLPSARPLRESEIIRFDVGGIYGPYCSDFARTYSSGNPTALQRRTYAALRRIQEEAIAAVRPGVEAEAIWELCRDAYAREGLVFRMGLVGHSLGVELHEAPIMRPGERIQFAPGMVLNLEVSVTDEADTYYHLEDLLVVTEAGTRLLTLGLAPREIPCIGEAVASCG